MLQVSCLESQREGPRAQLWRLLMFTYYKILLHYYPRRQPKRKNGRLFGRNVGHQTTESYHKKPPLDTEMKDPSPGFFNRPINRQPSQDDAISRLYDGQTHPLSRRHSGIFFFYRNRSCQTLLFALLFLFITVTRQMPPIRGVTKRFVTQRNRKKKERKKERTRQDNP